MKIRGFTLVELMIVVVIVGVLAALAIYGVRKYLANAKTAEARANVGKIMKDATTAYATELMNPTVMALKGSTSVSNRLCLAANPVPGNMADVAGKKYQSDPAEWTTGQPATGPKGVSEGFACLRFSIAAPQYYQYNYECSGADASKSGLVGTTFAAKAAGDLDGSGTIKTFTINGELRQSGTQLEAFVSPAIAED